MTTVYAAARARVVAVGVARCDDDDDGAPASAPHERWWDRVAPHIDADLTDLVARTVSAAWRRARASPRRGSRRPWLIAGCLAAALVAGGLLWPSQGEPPATAREGRLVSASPTATPRAASEPDAGEGTPPRVTDDLVATTVALLDARIACSDDDTCLRGIQEDPTRTLAGGVVDLPADRRSVTLIDEFGGAAVLRIDGDDRSNPSQFVVIVRASAQWLLRDVTSTAQQPD